MNSCVRSPINGWIDLKPFKMWCCAVLPTVFGEEMSYYEVLCKVKEILNGTITDVNLLQSEVQAFEAGVNKTIQEWENGGWIQQGLPYIEALLEQYIPVAIFFGLTQSGYFVAYIPDSWDEIQFGTTGYDVTSPMEPEFGHLVLSY